MTYHLSYDLRKIVSPVALALPNGEKLLFPSGAEAAKHTFDTPYEVRSFQEDNGRIEIHLLEMDRSKAPYQTEINEKDITTSPFF